ncbi:DEAD/DEAH box helicase [Luteibacter yeojuensis]|uniref:Helicase n=1 Tax=Luteibacter yeojuensis TaxID=345309 RepID=A0A0F3KFQ0_9GAMM|nr:DEAD/DEAH box helicase [Luteibacter yeojuensis]KJV30050.1 helicase [Luteibacter yeojuensis]
MLNIDYGSGTREAVITWGESDDDAPWRLALLRALADEAEPPTFEGLREVRLPWWSFSAARGAFLAVAKGYQLRIGEHFQVSPNAANLLKRSTGAASSFAASSVECRVSDAEVADKLRAAGFKRILSAHQRRNVGRMAFMPAAATFSVPGAGKTTEALAYYLVRRSEKSRLLVIAPKNAFAAWDEQLAECFNDGGLGFVRLEGGRDRIAELLDASPKFMLVSYQQLMRVPDLIANAAVDERSFVFLDESHRIKSGAAKQTARSVLGLAHIPEGKLILSGTPMPQSVEDLVPQFQFLYPEVKVNSDSVVDFIRRVYVRTTKAELDLPELRHVRIRLMMPSAQKRLYELMRSEVARDAYQALSIGGKQTLRAIGRSVAKLLQFVSNPALLSSDLSFSHGDLLADTLHSGDGPKVEYVLRRARELVHSGSKVLIWSSFVRNVEYLAARLDDLGAVYIHGGVGTGDDEDDDTREGKIRRFKEDGNTMVLVANPAAASEGISLHSVCHHAIYLDRSFNAAHYLQSEDRIHRFGLPKDQLTTVEIVECESSIDETVDIRLRAKIGRMAEVLNDPGLRIEWQSADASDDEGYEASVMSEEDIRAFLSAATNGGEP